MPIRSPAERRPCRGRYRAAQAARPIDAWLFATRRPPSRPAPVYRSPYKNTLPNRGNAYRFLFQLAEAGIEFALPAFGGGARDGNRFSNRFASPYASPASL